MNAVEIWKNFQAINSQYKIKVKQVCM